MTRWIPSGSATTLYEARGAVDAETIWDGGETRWDRDANIVRTRWDASLSLTGWMLPPPPSTAWS